MKPGDRVTYSRDPLLFGVMILRRVRPDGRLECRPLNAKYNSLGEVFAAHELELANDEMAEPLAERGDE